VKVDLAKGTWEFSFAGADPNNDPNAWTGKSKDLDITSMDARETGTCPFCGDKSAVQKSLLVVRSALPNWKIETADGVLTPGLNEIGNSSVRPLRSSSAGPATNAPTELHRFHSRRQASKVHIAIGNSHFRNHFASSSAN